MFEIKHGNILLQDTEALVNTVNCDGYMGKGIALQFKKAFPNNYKYYHNACSRKEVHPGKVLVFETGLSINPRFIINFPTKMHWKGKAKIEYIKTGMVSLRSQIIDHDIRSISIPPLGCGLGGLKWSDVYPIIKDGLSDLAGVSIFLYPPEKTPEASEMPIRTMEPTLTLSRILFLKLMKQYSRLAYKMSLLEIQKLAYFLQEAGQNLSLRFEKAQYGPFASNLTKVLELFESHYIEGFGDNQKPDVEIRLVQDKVPEIDKLQIEDTSAQDNLERVFALIDGFEMPYGMELLASVHWVATKDTPSARNPVDAYSSISNWTNRKKNLFSQEHVKVAWNRLDSGGWIK